MKLTAIEASTNKPLANKTLQLKINGKDVNVTTDGGGIFTLEDSLRGQKIILAGGLGQAQGTATDGAKLIVATQKSTAGSSAK